MCCFSQSVEAVSGTKIFARISQQWQYLVYQMNLIAKFDVAMVLPLPIKPNKNELGIEFINLSGYPQFFADMERCFPQSRSRSFTSNVAVAGFVDTLKVHRVGSFDASFVPTIQDFHRLDNRFCLPNDVWQKLPDYHDYGFAVFKLNSGTQKVHPMAFKFLTRTPHKIFFPTVHIHDGSVEKIAEFDHTLYLQSNTENLPEWQKSLHSVAKSMDLENTLKGDRTRGIINRQEILWKKRISGYFPNQDTVIGLC